MKDLTFTVLVISLAAVIGRMVFLELQVKNLKKLNIAIYKNAHQILNSFLDDLQKPLTGLLGVRSLYILENEQDPRVSDYTDIVEHCANHSNFEIDKARLFFELCSESYAPKSELGSVKELLMDASRVVRRANPSSYIQYNFERIGEDVQLSSIDKRLYKALFYLIMNQLSENIPHAIECSVTKLYNGQVQLDIVGMQVKGKYFGKGFTNVSDLTDQLMVENGTKNNLEDRLCGALQATLNIKVEHQVMKSEDLSQRYRLVLPENVKLTGQSVDNKTSNKRPAA